MRLSLLQPEVTRGNLDANIRAIQQLIGEAEGDLLILPEYALTGVPTAGADVREWAQRGAEARAALALPASKALLVNSIVERGGEYYNCCELLATGQRQCKLSPNELEFEMGIAAGLQQNTFTYRGYQFKVLIGADVGLADTFTTDGLDFAVWVANVPSTSLTQTLTDVKQMSATRNLRIFLSTLVADESVGMSAYLDGQIQLSLPRRESILEVIVA